MKPLGVLLATLTLPMALVPTSPVAALDHTTAPRSADATQSSILPVPHGGDEPLTRGLGQAQLRGQITSAWTAVRMPRVPKGVDGEGIVVAVVDSGVEALVPNLRGQVLPGKDFNRTPTKRGWHDPVAFGGHGTGVASIIVGNGRGSGVRGVAPGAKVLPVRVANKHGSSPDARIARAIRWAVAQDVDVINLSMGDDKSNPTLNAAIRYAVRKGVIFVAGAGNDGPDNTGPFYPAAIPEAIAVGGTGRNQSRVAGFSCRGDWVDLVAPGTWVPNTSNDGTYGIANGTSFASPYVAGVAALMLQVNPALTQDDVRDILTATATDIAVPGFDIEAGHGRLNAAKAVKKARSLYRRSR